MLLVHNFPNFPEQWTASNGLTGKSEYVRTLAGYLRFRQNKDAVFVVNCDPKLTLDVALQQVLFPFSPRPLIAVDVVLRRPVLLPAKVMTFLKRMLFKRVTHFIHYFKDVSGLYAVFGIDAARSSFIPFKVNIWDRRAIAAQPDGEYVLCFGRSLRDFDTFFAAMEQLPYPGAIVDPMVAKVWDHGSKFSRPITELPKNIRIVDHDLTNESQAEVLSRAKIVVLPILKETIVSAGISTALNAMAMGKCIIASAGPGVTDIFKDELLSVPPEDAVALAAKIREAWEQNDLRTKTAEAGYRYALECGEEQALYKRVIDEIARVNVFHTLAEI